VILDADLASLYGVENRALIQAVKRNAKRFPQDFLFQLTKSEFDVLRSQIVISKGRGGRRSLPYAFTEHGAVMAANLLNSERAVEMSVEVVRAHRKCDMFIVTSYSISLAPFGRAEMILNDRLNIVSARPNGAASKLD
jgi:ORF6N domain